MYTYSSNQTQLEKHEVIPTKKLEKHEHQPIQHATPFKIRYQNIV